MSKKIKYVPPAAEVILLAPCESLAAWEYSFERTWKNPGRFTTTPSGLAGIAFGDDKFDSGDATSGFFDPTGTE